MFSIKNFFSKCDQIRRKLRIWSHILKKSLMENFIFCTVKVLTNFKLNGHLDDDSKENISEEMNSGVYLYKETNS